MAAQPQPQPDQAQAGAAPAGDSGSADQGPSQSPANQKQIMLAQLYQACKRLAQEDPVLSAGLQKAAQGIQEAQTAMISQPAPQPTSSSPPY